MIFLYQLFLQVIRLLKPVIRLLPHKKIRYFFRHEGRLQGELPSGARPLWIHASSGEIEYAKSLIRELQLREPHIPLLLTHTSLSSEKVIQSLKPAVWGVAPLDTPQDVRTFLNRWKPRACLIARTDLWPQMLLELHRAQIPAYLFSATFAKGSGKISFLARRILQTCLPLLKKIYFVSVADQKACEKFYSQIRGEVMGDTRYDQVLYRLKNSPHIKLERHSPTLIAGSTWDEDEKVLTPAFAELKKARWKFILVPHEVDEAHLRSVGERLEKFSLNFHRLSQGLETFSWDRYDGLLVDQVGVLASLYSYADIAFIGGSFRKQVHSVMEALAAPCPVIVGPYYTNNREAIEFEAEGLVCSVKNGAELMRATHYFEHRFEKMQVELRRMIQSKSGVTENLLQELRAEGCLS